MCVLLRRETDVKPTSVTLRIQKYEELRIKLETIRKKNVVVQHGCQIEKEKPSNALY